MFGRKSWRHARHADLYFCSHFDDAAVAGDELLRRDGEGGRANVDALRPVHPGKDQDPTRALHPDHFAKTEDTDKKEHVGRFVMR